MSEDPDRRATVQCALDTRSRHGPGASNRSGSSVMSVTRTPGDAVQAPTIWPSGRTAKLGHPGRPGRRVVRLIHMWFSAARHDIVDGTIVRQMLYDWSSTTVARALWNDCSRICTPWG
ncbi:MAG: hypothetical protein Ct9H300mP1_07060 [Planctomycetaceae bacterium]|nr:MAG: hypothetical protein Ct9H300mP1_07060 [Planctomycetaceae bacterium]